MVLAAKGGGERQLPAMCQALGGEPLGLAPIPSAHQQERPAGAGELLRHRGHRLLRRHRHRRRRRLERRHGRFGRQHVLGQHHHHRAAAAGSGQVKGAQRRLRQSGGIVHHQQRLDESREAAAPVHLLESLALAHAPRHIPHKQHQRRIVLTRHMEPGAGIGRPGAAGDEGNTGASGELAPGLRHHGHAALLAAGDEADLGMVDETVEDGEETLARDLEDAADAETGKLLHQQPAGMAHGAPPLLPGRGSLSVAPCARRRRAAPPCR